VPASIYRRQKRVEFRKKPGAVPLVPMIKVGAATSRRLRAGREPENEHSSARDAARRQEKHSPNKRAPQHDTAREPRDRLQLDKLREQKAVEDVPKLLVSEGPVAYSYSIALHGLGFYGREAGVVQMDGRQSRAKADIQQRLESCSNVFCSIRLRR